LILGIFPLGRPRLESALYSALVQYDADLLTDVEIRHEGFWALVVGWETVTVEGNAVNTQEIAKAKKER